MSDMNTMINNRTIIQMEDNDMMKIDKRLPFIVTFDPELRLLI